ncbi:MAG TPA: choice-of-anchor D domain-containing protein [archaeon]|nr:choice-of-anchor D domain-containing protein [archaeon]
MRSRISIITKAAFFLVLGSVSGNLSAQIVDPNTVDFKVKAYDANNAELGDFRTASGAVSADTVGHKFDLLVRWEAPKQEFSSGIYYTITFPKGTAVNEDTLKNEGIKITYRYDEGGQQVESVYYVKAAEIEIKAANDTTTATYSALTTPEIKIKDPNTFDISREVEIKILAGLWYSKSTDTANEHYDDGNSRYCMVFHLNHSSTTVQDGNFADSTSFYLVEDPQLNPEIALSLTSISFGDILVGSSQDTSFTITNDGNAYLVVSDISSDNGVFTVSPTTATIPPGQNRNVTVTLSPTATGSQSAIVTVTSNDSDEGTLTVSMSGTGVSPEIGLSKTSLTIANVSVGSSGSGTFILTNDGTADLVVSSMTSNNSLFTVNPASVTIVPGQYQIVTITFTPTGTESQNATISIISDDIDEGLLTVAVSGNGSQAPEITLSATSVSIGDVTIGSSGSGTFTITNDGNIDLVVSSIISNNGMFKVSPAYATIAKGQSQVVTLTFTPAAAGAQNATITVASNDSDEGTLTVEVSATGKTVIIPVYYSLSGSVKIGSAGLADASVHITGSGVDTTFTTGPDGSYSLADLAEGTYTVTPSKTSYSFSPASVQVTISGSNASAQVIAASTITRDVISVGDARAYAGGYDTVDVFIITESDYPAAEITLSFDPTKFRYVDGTLTFNSELWNQSWGSPTIALDTTAGTIKVGFISFVSLNAKIPKTTAKKRLFSVVLKVKNGVPPGTEKISVSGMFINSDFEEMRVADTNLVPGNFVVLIGEVYDWTLSGSLKGAGSLGNEIFFAVDNEIDIPGVTFEMHYDSTLLEYQSVQLFGRAEKMAVTSQSFPGFVRVILLGATGNIKPGSSDIGKISFKVKEGVESGTFTTLRLTDKEEKVLLTTLELKIILQADVPVIDSLSVPSFYPGDSLEVIAWGRFPQPGIQVDLGDDPNIELLGVNQVSAAEMRLTVSVSWDAGEGEMDITLVTPDGDRFLGYKGFPIVLRPAPKITSVTPSEVLVGSQSVSLTIDGSWFNKGDSLYFSGSGIIIRSSEYISSKQWTVTMDISSDAPLGFRDIIVVNPADSTGVGKTLFKVLGLPRIFSVSPFFILPGLDSVAVAINGRGLAEDVVVEFSGDGINLLGQRLAAPSQLIAMISVDKDAAPGTRDLQLRLKDYAFSYSGALMVKKDLPPEIVLPDQLTVREGVQLSFILQGRDPEGGPLIFQSGELPVGASLTGRSFTWQPGYDQQGTYSVEFTVSDRLGDSVSGSVDIEVLNRNQRPAFTRIGNQKSAVGEETAFEITGRDPDGDRLDLRAQGLPSGVSYEQTDDTTFAFRWTPSAEDLGTVRAHLTLSDPFGGYDRRNMAFTATEPDRQINQPPEFVDLQSEVIDEGETFELAVQASDPDGDPVVVFTGPLPQHADFDPVTGSFSFRPDYTQAGVYSFLFVATDGLLSANQKVTVEVKDKDLAPAILPVAPKEVFEGARLSFAVAAVDSGGDVLNYTADNLPRGASLDPLAGIFRFTPDYTQEGDYSVKLRATDPAGNHTETTASVKVKHANQPPRLDNIPSPAAQPGDTISLFVSAVDPDGDSLEFGFTSSDLPDTLFDKGTQMFTYHAGDKSGAYEGWFIVRDNSGAADSQMVIINIVAQGANSPPTIGEIPDRYYYAGDTVSLTLSAQDPEGGKLSYSVYNAGDLPNKMRNVSSGGTYEFTATREMAGRYRVIFQVSDGTLSAVTDAIITIETDNSPPELNPISTQTVNEGETLAVNFSASDPDGEALSYSISLLPRGAGFDRTSGRFTITPDFDQADTLSLGVSVSDGQASATGSFQLVIIDTNRPPVIHRVRDPEVEEGGLVEFEIEADDPDGDSLWIEIDTTGIPFLGGASQANGNSARLRDASGLLLDSDKLEDDKQIPAAWISFYAVDQHGARSAEEAVDIAVLRRKLAQLTGLEPGLVEQLLWDGLGIKIEVKNNTTLAISSNISVLERSGRLKQYHEDLAAELLLSGVSESGEKRKLDPAGVYGYTYLSASGDELVFYGIRRSWKLDLSDLPAETEITVTFDYFEEDLPKDLEGFKETKLSLFGLDSVTSQFVKVEDAVIDWYNNAVIFKVDNRSLTDYTLGFESILQAPSLKVEVLIGGQAVETDSTYDTRGPYTVRAAAPEGALVTNATLYYRPDSLAGYQSGPMQKITGDQNMYAGQIPGLGKEGTIRYYVRMVIDFETVTSPSNSPVSYHELKVLFSTPGDVDKNSKVDIFDLLELLKVLSGRVASSSSSDVDRNGATNIFDLLELLKILSH